MIAGQVAWIVARAADGATGAVRYGRNSEIVSLIVRSGSGSPDDALKPRAECEAFHVLRSVRALDGIALVAVAVAMQGCAFGTNRVSVPSPPVASAQSHGPTTLVLVRDARPEVSGGIVGFKRNGYGAKTGSVSLPNGTTVESLLQADLVSILQGKGYMASVRQEDAADLKCIADVRSLLIDSRVGFWTVGLVGNAVIDLTLTRTKDGQAVWSSIVKATVDESAGMAVTAGDHQRAFSALHRALVAQLVEEIPSAPSDVSQSRDDRAPSGRLRALQELRDQGLISDAEYIRKRRELLREL